MPSKHFANDQEKYFFTHFRTTTVAQLGGDFNTAVWTPLVLQACETSPQILHAAIAIGALSFAASKLRNPNSQLGPEYRAFAFKQYSKALSLHRESTILGNTSLRTNLITCLVVVYFEVMAGFIENGARITHSGIKLLEQNFLPKDPEKRTSVSSPAPLQVEDVLVQAFGRMDLCT